MTREEEIKDRLDNGYWTIQRAFRVQDGYDGGLVSVINEEQKDKDLRYLLARNKELQRRVEKMEAVVDIGRRIVSANDDSIAVLNGEKKISNKKGFLDALAYEMSVLEFKLKKELSALDAADAKEK